MARESAEIVIQIRDDGSLALRGIAKSAKELGEQSEKTESAVGKLWHQIAGGVTVGTLAADAINNLKGQAVDFAKESLALAGNWQRGMGQIADDAGLGAAGVAKLGKEFDAISLKTGASAEALMLVGEKAAELGVGKDQLAAFANTAASMAVALDGSGKNAGALGEKVLELARAIGMESGLGADFDAMGNVLVGLNDAMHVSTDGLIAYGVAAGRAGKDIGLAGEEVLAVGAAMLQQGIDAEQGGQVLNRVFLAIRKDLDEGGKGLEMWAQLAGQSVGEFKTAMELDAVGALRQVFSGLGDAKKAGGEYSTALDELGLKSPRVGKAISALADSSGGLETALGKVREEAGKTGSALSDKLKLGLDNSTAQVERAAAVWEQLSRNFGASITPQVAGVTKAFADVSETLNLGAVAGTALGTALRSNVVAVLTQLVGKTTDAAKATVEYVEQTKSASAAGDAAAAAWNKWGTEIEHGGDAVGAAMVAWQGWNRTAEISNEELAAMLATTEPLSTEMGELERAMMATALETTTMADAAGAATAEVASMGDAMRDATHEALDMGLAVEEGTRGIQRMTAEDLSAYFDSIAMSARHAALETGAFQAELDALANFSSSRDIGGEGMADVDLGERSKGGAVGSAGGIGGGGGPRLLGGGKGGGMGVGGGGSLADILAGLEGGNAPAELGPFAGAAAEAIRRGDTGALRKILESIRRQRDYYEDTGTVMGPKYQQAETALNSRISQALVELERQRAAQGDDLRLTPPPASGAVGERASADRERQMLDSLNRLNGTLEKLGGFGGSGVSVQIDGREVAQTVARKLERGEASGGFGRW